ncbi:hypothetical protein A2Z22_03495 [Candidatus Woesebacteria bacterium RBG_16_34_12]|uniref:DNA helicase UvrD n=1 Tax=Candidatus Woesebacteria bacterium RBG_16_34_12 TaxID=1802480 RepID=A0A1F7XCK5_9BACT|nr:MAG: hypothetical protein A2Z22_03495 [Candidatus Woesebacteria bacterium RBG_16_34_12]
MKIIADLHLHSRFSRAVSQQMTIPIISEWANKKGIDLVATADWTHPIWFRELKSQLTQVEEGLYRLKSNAKGQLSAVKFILSTELSSIYSQAGATRRVHYLVFAPSLEVAEKINLKLKTHRVNLLSDGRPILGLAVKDVTYLVLETDPRCLIIPAHIWTPWFSLYGSMSGFDSIDECFGNLAKNIYAVETGLSSDPAMNWRVEELDSRQIISSSDAHSPQKLGREATVFELSELSYESVRRALVNPVNQEDQVDHENSINLVNRSTRLTSRISYTIEFYPEEGKYHYTGHRNCEVVYSPNEARKKGLICPVCGKKLTVGVMSRVESLAKKEVNIETGVDVNKVNWIKDRNGNRPPYIMLVPLEEIIAESLNIGVGSKTVREEYEHLINELGNEFAVLIDTPVRRLEEVAGRRISEGIEKVRTGNLVIDPGYDGVFGKVKIWKEEIQKEKINKVSQSTLFG